VVKRNKIPRRKEDRDKANILKLIKEDVEKMCGDLQTALDEEFKYKRLLALELHSWRNYVIVKSKITTLDWVKFNDIIEKLERIERGRKIKG
jgi:hypothetical protein